MSEKRKYKVEGMFCAACVKKVEDAAKKVAGVEAAEVNLLLNTLDVTYGDGIKEDDLFKSLKRSGYHATSLESDKAVKKAQSKEFIKRSSILGVSVFLFLILAYFSIGFMYGWPTGGNPFVTILIQCIIATIIIGLNFEYYIKGFIGLFTLKPGMETLVSLGSIISYGYSFYPMVLAAEGKEDIPMVFFSSAAMILVMVSVGKLIEAVAKRKTTASLEALFALAPEYAYLKDGDEFNKVAIKELKLNDIVRVRAGEVVPCDGEIIEGYGYLEEASITGEPLPKYKQVNEKVIGGTLNRTGYFLFKVTSVGEEAMLNKIIALVEEASRSKAKLARLTDKVSAWFVPIVITLSLITFLGWFFARSGEPDQLSLALNMAISVMVITCPCALSLATPVAMMVGAGKGAENGLLIKSAESFESLAKINTFAFDKTGTITTGHIIIAEKQYFNDFDVNDVISSVVSLESKANHPLAITLCHYLKLDGAKTLEVNNFEEKPGYGIKGEVNHQLVVIGNADHVLNYTKDALPEAVNSFASKIYVVINNKLAAYFELIDTVKDEAKDVIETLKKKGAELYLISGDNESASKSLAAKLGIDNVFYGVKPEGKQDIIDSLKAKGKKVAMVGDGLNDALALESADLAISLGSASNIAIESADVVLMHDDLNSLLDAIDLSKKVTKNIKINLLYAFIYNAIGIPVAAGALYALMINGHHFMLNPILSASIMALSSLSVVLNALRLKKLRFRVAKNSGPSKELILNIEGMKCPKCQAHALEALQNVSGVRSVVVSLENKNAHVTLDEGVSNKILVKAISEAGYEVTSIKKGKTMIAKNNHSLIGVEGMMCEKCVAHVEDALNALQGVKKLSVSLENKLVDIEYDSSLKIETIKEAITKAGYEVIDVRNK